MHGGVGRSNIALRGLAVALTLVLASCYGEPRRSAEQHDTGQHDAEAPVDPVSPPTRTSVYEEACADADEAGRDDPNYHDKRDLCAQYRAAVAAEANANSALLQLWLSGAGLVAILITLWFTGWSARASSEQARIARKAFEELERPYLFAQVRPKLEVEGVISKKDIENQSDPSAILEYDFSNLGRSPALIVSFDRKRYALRISEGRPEPLDYSEKGEDAPHGAVVPVDDRSQAFTMREIPSRGSEPTTREDPFVWYFIGYVVYKQVGSEQRYVKGFGYRHSLGLDGGSWVLIDTGRQPDEYNFDHKIEDPPQRRPFVERLGAAWAELTK